MKQPVDCRDHFRRGVSCHFKAGESELADVSYCTGHGLGIRLFPKLPNTNTNAKIGFVVVQFCSPETALFPVAPLLFGSALTH